MSAEPVYDDYIVPRVMYHLTNKKVKSNRHDQFTLVLRLGHGGDNCLPYLIRLH
jgi:hypothetical protein